jgi:hypothetical protein
MAARIIVNADDFGMSRSVNEAIVSAIDHGLATRASIMANMPGFVDACRLVRRRGWTDRIGVHLNLSEGWPLSDPIRRCRRFCDDFGRFRPWRRTLCLTREERRAVEVEFGAQVQACIDQGLRPTHLDSHHHYHTEWPIGAVAIRIARDYGIREVRMSRNCGPGLGWLKRLYKAAFNARLRLHGLAAVEYFGGLDDLPSVLERPAAVEVMVHPRFDDAGRLTDMGRGRELVAFP